MAFRALLSNAVVSDVAADPPAFEASSWVWLWFGSSPLTVTTHHPLINSHHLLAPVDTIQEFNLDLIFNISSSGVVSSHIVIVLAREPEEIVKFFMDFFSVRFTFFLGVPSLTPAPRSVLIVHSLPEFTSWFVIVWSRIISMELWLIEIFFVCLWTSPLSFLEVADVIVFVVTVRCSFSASHASAHLAFTCFAEAHLGIILIPLLLIAQSLISRLHLQKLKLRHFIIRVEVRVIFLCKFEITEFYLFFRGCRSHRQIVIMIRPSLIEQNWCSPKMSDLLQDTFLK